MPTLGGAGGAGAAAAAAAAAAVRSGRRSGGRSGLGVDRQRTDVSRPGLNLIARMRTFIE